METKIPYDPALSLEEVKFLNRIGAQCQYCGSAEEVTTHYVGDESADVCESCYDNLFA